MTNHQTRARVEPIPPQPNRCETYGCPRPPTHYVLPTEQFYPSAARHCEEHATVMANRINDAATALRPLDERVQAGDTSLTEAQAELIDRAVANLKATREMTEDSVPSLRPGEHLRRTGPTVEGLWHRGQAYEILAVTKDGHPSLRTDRGSPVTIHIDGVTSRWLHEPNTFLTAESEAPR